MKLTSKSTSLIVILVIVSGCLLIEYAEPHSCTIFTAVQGETVLFGDNWDYHEGDLIIGFFPPSATRFGSVHRVRLGWNLYGFKYPKLNLLSRSG